MKEKTVEGLGIPAGILWSIGYILYMREWNGRSGGNARRRSRQKKPKKV
jgi:hypothetical protein